MILVSTKKTLRERLILGMLDAHREGDPTLLIGVSADELKVSWMTDTVPGTGPDEETP